MHACVCARACVHACMHAGNRGIADSLGTSGASTSSLLPQSRSNPPATKLPRSNFVPVCFGPIDPPSRDCQATAQPRLPKPRTAQPRLPKPRHSRDFQATHGTAPESSKPWHACARVINTGRRAAGSDGRRAHGRYRCHAHGVDCIDAMPTEVIVSMPCPWRWEQTHNQLRAPNVHV